MKIYATNKPFDVQSLVGQDIWIRCSAPEEYLGQHDVFYNFTEYNPDTDRYYYKILPAHFVDDYFQDPEQYAYQGKLWFRSHGNMSRRVFDDYYSIAMPIEMYTTAELSELFGV